MASGDVWLRLLVAEAEAREPDGEGVPGGYEMGETEDLLLHNTQGSWYAP